MTRRFKILSYGGDTEDTNLLTLLSMGEASSPPKSFK